MRKRADDHPATGIVGRLGDCRLISGMFDIPLLTDRPVTAVTRRSVAQGENNLLGMALLGLLEVNTITSSHFDLKKLSE